MTNEEIVKNAPDWATHWAVNNKRPFDSEYAVLCENDVYRNLREARFNNDKWTFTPLDELKTTESVYTQEMKDNGEPVKVGMKFKASGSTFTAGLVGDFVAACVRDGMIVTVDFEHIEPIVSEREEAEAKQLRDCFAEYTNNVIHSETVTKEIRTNLKRLQKAGLLAEIILPLKRS